MAMPDDLAARIKANAAALEDIVDRLRQVEERQATDAQVVSKLRHDFNNLHLAIQVLMEEVDERVPVPDPSTKRK